MENPIKPPFSYGFPMVFLWFSYGLPEGISIFICFPDVKQPMLQALSSDGSDWWQQRCRSDARRSPFWESHQPWLAIETTPICSMYGIFTNIYPINEPNVGKYTIHGAYGTMKQPKIIDKSMQIARLGEFLLWCCSENRVPKCVSIAGGHITRCAPPFIGWLI